MSLLSAVVHRVRSAVTRVVGRVGAVVRATTRPAPVVLGLLRDLHPALLMYDADKNAGGFVRRLRVNDRRD